MKYEFDKENFLRKCAYVPPWIKSGQDLLNYFQHMQYREIEKEERKSYSLWEREQENMSDDEKLDQELELNVLMSEAWKHFNDPDYVSFEKICEINSARSSPFAELHKEIMGEP